MSFLTDQIGTDQTFRDRFEALCFFCPLTGCSRWSAMFSFVKGNTTMEVTILIRCVGHCIKHQVPKWKQSKARRECKSVNQTLYNTHASLSFPQTSCLLGIYGEFARKVLTVKCINAEGCTNWRQIGRLDSIGPYTSRKTRGFPGKTILLFF